MGVSIATLLVSIASLLVTSTIAITVARTQIRATKDKLRLDLYERRFAVYLKTLAFHQVLAGPREFFLTDEFRSIHGEFIKAMRESQYLFADDSGILELLENLHGEAFKIKAVKENGENMPPEHFLEMFNNSMAALATFNRAIPDLEKRLKPYLSFQKVLV